MGVAEFTWPAGCYVNNEEYQNVLMAMHTVMDATGVHFGEVTGTAEELAALSASYSHLQVMRN